MTDRFDTTPECALRLDAEDPLAHMRTEFTMPLTSEGTEEIYLAGNSLGLAPNRTRAYVDTELDKWARLGVRGHFETDKPWAPYHEFLTDQMAVLVGGRANEVVVMNALTVNLHMLMVSFYRPTAKRYKILIEDHAFPSDHFAVESQIRFHGLTVGDALVIVKPRDGEDLLRQEAISAAIEQHSDELALILLPGVQYYTGQVLDMAAITRLGHAAGAKVGFDLAHAVGNIPLSLHDWDVDFAAWCTYKYLNSGPGSTGACFVHERHLNSGGISRFEGWWGTNKEHRFEMETKFDPLPSVEAWQVSNAPVFSMAAIRASLDVFDAAGGIQPLRTKTELQVAYLDYLLEKLFPHKVHNITPQPMHERGCQFALRIVSDGVRGKDVYDALEAAGVACDWRHPDVIRVAPVPLYNSYTDIRRFVTILEGLLR